MDTFGQKYIQRNLLFIKLLIQPNFYDSLFHSCLSQDACIQGCDVVPSDYYFSTSDGNISEYLNLELGQFAGSMQKIFCRLHSGVYAEKCWLEISK